MANTTVINGEEVRVNETSKGTVYSKNFRSLTEEVSACGTDYARLNPSKHAFFLGGNSYYVGPSLQDKDFNGLRAVAEQIQICDSSIDGENWVPTLFLPTVGEGGSMGLLKK